MKLVVKPSHEDQSNSVDVFDADRVNEFGGMYCVAPAIHFDQVDDAWDKYTEYRAEEMAENNS